MTISVEHSNKKEPLISVIVPVYNTEKYLPRCLDSILSQSFTDFELILIDDGSKDGSGVICNAYASKDDRIRVFHKENGGVSSARNLGIDNSKGEWLYFADSDDELLPNGLQTLVNCIDNDVDVVMGGYEKFNEEGDLLESVQDRAVVTLDKKKSLSSLYHGHTMFYSALSYTWLRLFRKKIIDYHRIRFDETLSNKEDTLFITEYLCKSNGVTRFDTTPVYWYFWRQYSAMSGWRYGFDRSYIDSLYALIKMKQEIERYYPGRSDVVYVAKEGIWVRYNKIIGKAKHYNVEDTVLLNKLHNDVKKELKLSFFIQKKTRKIIRKWFH